MNTVELATALGVSSKTINDYVRRGCPTDSPEAARSWKEENIARNGPPTIGERSSGVVSRRYASHELDEAEQRAKIAKLEEEARGRRIKNDKEMGSLVYRDDVEQSATELTLRIKQRLEAIPIELEPEIPIDLRAQLTARWSEKIALILTEMSQMQLTSQERSVASDYENEADDV